MTKTSYEKEGLNSLNELFEKLIVCSEKQDKASAMRIVSSLNDEEKDYLYTWASERGNLDKVAGIVIKAEMDKKAFDINCRFKKQVLEALPIHGYCLENDPANPDSLGNDTIKFTDNKYINGVIRLRDRKVDLEARDAENKKYEKTIDYSEVEDLMESINHFRKDIEETFEKAEPVVEEVKEEPFDILNDKEFMKQIGADWAVNLAKKEDAEIKKEDLKKEAGSSNFTTQEGYPLIAVIGSYLLTEKDYIDYWNENNPDEPITSIEGHEEDYSYLAGDYENDAVEEMKAEISSAELPDGFKLTVEPGYYEGAQLVVEEPLDRPQDFDTWLQEKYSEYYSDLTAEEVKHHEEEYEKEMTQIEEADKAKVVQVMEDLGKKLGWLELAVAYRFSNGETGYSIVDKKSSKESTIEKEADEFVQVPESDEEMHKLFERVLSGETLKFNSMEEVYLGESGQEIDEGVLYIYYHGYGSFAKEPTFENFKWILTEIVNHD